MQIKSVFISNIASFPYTEDKSKTVFFNIEGNEWVNVLIGPNGAGKTNFLNIIKTVVGKGLIEDRYLNFNAENTNDTISLYTNTASKLTSHFLFTDKSSFVNIDTQVRQHDKENLLFLQKQREQLNTIIKTYSTSQYQIPALDPKDIMNVDSVSIDFYVDTKNKTIEAKYNGNNPIEQFVFDFLKYEELFHLCIVLFNERIKKAEEQARSPLKNTFAFLDSRRNFAHIEETHLNHKAWEHYVGKKDNSSTNFPGYALCIRKIRDIINNHSEENADSNIPAETLDETAIKAKLDASKFFRNLQASIKKYLELDLQLAYHGEDIEFIFIDEDGMQHGIHELSQWEQSFLVILFTVYGNDLRDGLLIIDEPEIHFHPQIQRRLSRLLERLTIEFGTQCIISTYSPIFINEKNVSNVYRFNKINGGTNIKTPGNSIGEDESTLIQILKFENASKIFFVDKIIMVEGEIDAYFFEFYLQYLHTFPERKPYLKNYEIININGKWSYRKRNKFLSKFDIESHFIGDWDNIVDYGFVTQNDLNFYYRQARTYSNKHWRGWDRHYTKLVNTVKDLYPKKYESIIEHISTLYKHNIFILQRWDIETYLGMKTKWVEETIEFCHNFFGARLKNPDLADHRKEFEAIMAAIFHKPTDTPISELGKTHPIVERMIWAVPVVKEPSSQWVQIENTEQKKTEPQSSVEPSPNSTENDIFISNHNKTIL